MIKKLIIKHLLEVDDYDGSNRLRTRLFMD